MPVVILAPVANHLLNGVSRGERNRIIQSSTLVNLEFGDVLCEQDEVFNQVYFPLTALVSLVSILPNHPPMEMGMVGNEGMLGATLMLNVETFPVRALVQGTGTALRMSVTRLREELKTCPGLQRILKRYLYVLIAQMSRSAACVHFHEIEPRLARWLLMTHDRSYADHFHLTHEFLAGMLGVCRSGITIAAGTLQRRGLICYSRGEITILDRAGLEAASCECYATVSKYYTSILADSLAV